MSRSSVRGKFECGFDGRHDARSGSQSLLTVSAHQWVRSTSKVPTRGGHDPWARFGKICDGCTLKEAFPCFEQLHEDFYSAC
jgi:hypothetical protein